MCAVGPAEWLGELARLAAGAVSASAAAARSAAARRGVQRSRERMFRESTPRQQADNDPDEVRYIRPAGAAEPPGPRSDC